MATRIETDTLGPYQMTLLKGFYGKPLTEAELEIWRECTKRDYPATPFAALTVVSGARSGKNAYILVPILLYESLYGGFIPNPGETVVVVLVAQDARASRLSHRLVREYLKRSPLLAPHLVGETKDSVRLANGIAFHCYPSTSKSLYGYSIIAGGIDELARFRFEGATDSDADIQAGILRGMAHYGNRAKLLKASSPSGRSGLLYRDYQRSFAKPDVHRVVWQSTSEKMAPGIVDSAFITRMRQEDPFRAARLFDAEFAEDVNVFLTANAVEAVTDHGVTERLPEAGARYVAACDPAGHGEDAFTLSIVAQEGTAADLRVTQVFQQAWQKPRSGLRDLDDTVTECAAQLKRYGLRRVYGDRGMSGWVLEAFRRRGIEYLYPFIKREGAEVYVTRSIGYLEAAPLIRAQRVRLLDDEGTRAELRNLEQRGERVDHGAGLHDDRANSLALAICMAVQGAVRPGFKPLVFSYTKSYTPRASAAGRSENVEEGVEVRTAFGLETYKDPRGDDPDRQAPKPVTHDVDDAAHRSECRRCRQAWRTRP